jgi:arylsulfatase A-like enzyme
MHDAAVKIPMIVVDPSAAADNTRGSVNAALVESIDLVTTFIEVYGGAVPNHQIEGRSLLPLLHDDKNKPWRQYAISEYDFSQQPAAIRLGLTVAQANLLMITDGRFKYRVSRWSDLPFACFRA